MRHKKGQSTLEYILLVTAVLLVIIGFVASGNSPFKAAVNQTLVDGVDQVYNQSNKIGKVLTY